MIKCLRHEKDFPEGPHETLAQSFTETPHAQSAGNSKVWQPDETKLTLKKWKKEKT